MDEALAHALGWTCQEEGTYSPNTEMVWRDTQGMKVSVPCFTTSLDAMRLVEDEIRKQQKEGAYCRALADLVEFDGRAYEDYGDVGLEPLIYATPAQRAEAALKALTAGQP